MSLLRKQIVRLAHANPKFRSQLLGVLRKQSAEKQAFDKESEDFVEWAANLSPLSKQETISALRDAGITEILPPIQKREGPRFVEKDTVLVNASKHTNPETEAVYKEYDGKIGTVVGTEGASVMVQFKSGQPVTFPDGMNPRGVGLYRWTPAYDIEGSKKLEIIYEAGKEAKPDRMVVVKQYLGRGRGSVERKAPYYTGHAFSVRYNKAGGIYFSLRPQQRLHVDPQGGKTEAGFDATSMNPEVGKLHYLGVFGKRPAGWKKELEEMRAQAEGMAARVAKRDMAAKFEAGKPADPTLNMSEEDKAKWYKMHKKYKDNFKK